jgi:Mor family transcriptional regulator
MTKLGVTYNKKNSISDYIKPEEIQRCLNNNMSIEEIAEKFNCSVWPIRRIINENNLRAKSKKRNLSEIEKLSNKYNVSLEVIKKVIETELDILGRSGIIKKYSLYK